MLNDIGAEIASISIARRQILFVAGKAFGQQSRNE
jgi:hypothetical protein